MSKRKQREEDHVGEDWLLPYADMLTLLLALFIVLFAMSEVDAKKYEQLAQVLHSDFAGGSGPLEQQPSPVESPKQTTDEEKEEKTEDRKESKDELQELSSLQKEVDTYIEKNDLSDVLDTSMVSEGLMIVILNDVFFDSGSAEVNADEKEIAREISGFLYSNPPRAVVVSGHTDDQPIVHATEFSSNWDLSAMRAINFMRILLENEDLKPEYFSAKGYGEHNPVVPNTKEANRAKNRRVEVLVRPNVEDTE